MWTLQNLMDYCKDRDIDLFEGCTAPDPIDINLLKSYIMLRCGLLQPIYGEPLVFKMQVKMWFDSNQWRMDHLVKMLLADYEPAENIYEHEEWEETHSGTDTNGGSDSLQHGETHTLSGKDSLTHGETHTLSGKDTDADTTSTEHKVSAYNSTTYQADSQDQRGGSIETTYGKKDTASGTDDTTYGKKDTASGTDTTTFGKTFTHGENIEYTKDRHGNVGVKSSSDLMQEELNLLERFNVYDTLASWFEKANMIQVY